MFDLTSYLPYLLNRAGARIADHFSAWLRTEYDLTLPMWRVLAALYHQDGQRVGRLATMTTIEVSTLSRLLGTMQRRGLLARQRPSIHVVGRDARAVTIHLTQAGRERTEQIIPAAQRYEAIALSGLSQEEVDVLHRLLRRLFDNMDRFDGAPSEAERIAS